MIKRQIKLLIEDKQLRNTLFAILLGCGLGALIGIIGLNLIK